MSMNVLSHVFPAMQTHYAQIESGLILVNVFKDILETGRPTAQVGNHPNRFRTILAT